jgi:hypothetical protein
MNITEDGVYMFLRRVSYVSSDRTVIHLSRQNSAVLVQFAEIRWQISINSKFERRMQERFCVSKLCIAEIIIIFEVSSLTQPTVKSHMLDACYRLRNAIMVICMDAMKSRSLTLLLYHKHDNIRVFAKYAYSYCDAYAHC